MDSNLDFLPFLLQKYKNNNEFISLITLFFQEKKQGHNPVHRVVNQQLEQLGKVIGIPIHLSSEFKAYLSNKDNRIPMGQGG